MWISLESVIPSVLQLKDSGLADSTRPQVPELERALVRKGLKV